VKLLHDAVPESAQRARKAVTSCVADHDSCHYANGHLDNNYPQTDNTNRKTTSRMHNNADAPQIQLALLRDALPESPQRTTTNVTRNVGTPTWAAKKCLHWTLHAILSDIEENCHPHISAQPKTSITRTD